MTDNIYIYTVILDHWWLKQNKNGCLSLINFFWNVSTCCHFRRLTLDDWQMKWSSARCGRLKIVKNKNENVRRILVLRKPILLGLDRKNSRDSQTKKVAWSDCHYDESNDSTKNEDSICGFEPYHSEEFWSKIANWMSTWNMKMFFWFFITFTMFLWFCDFQW